MATQQTPPDYHQYGLKGAGAQAVDVYANRPGGEKTLVGPADAVDAAGHRLGEMEARPAQKPSSRMGQAVINEVDDQQRSSEPDSD